MPGVWCAFAPSGGVSVASPKDCFGSNSAVAAVLTPPPLWIRERYGPAGTKRQILSTRLSAELVKLQTNMHHKFPNTAFTEQW